MKLKSGNDRNRIEYGLGYGASFYTYELLTYKWRIHNLNLTQNLLTVTSRTSFDFEIEYMDIKEYLPLNKLYTSKLFSAVPF